jgi:hypothetical protein
MRIGAALFLIAVGAILTFAVSDRISGIDLSVVGIILMIVGVIGLVLTMVFWSGRSTYGRRERVVERDVPPERPTDREPF